MKYAIYSLSIICATLLIGCSSAEGDFPGTEYMPDMAHSIAYEPNLYDYYYYNTWGTEEEYYALAQPRKPVKHTIPRGDAGFGAADGLAKATMNGMPMNGHVPYHYLDTEEERTRASVEITKNPYPITLEGLDRGKELYVVNCGICHGEKGDGEGYLVSESNAHAVYPAQPANLVNDEFTAASAGRFYHAIMYGKNVMGGYADKLSYEERWQVIHWMRALQAKKTGAEYSDAANTLNQEATPYQVFAAAMSAATDMKEEAQH